MGADDSTSALFPVGQDDPVIRRRALMGGVVAVLAVPRLACSQTARKLYRVGYLSTQTPAFDAARIDAFRQQLRDLGWVEGQNVALEFRFAEGRLERLGGFAAEFVRLNVDVIVTGGSPGTRAALKATRTVPLVMTVVGDPIDAGFVASLGRPGGTVTGLTQMSPQLVGKRLELLKEALPRIARVAVLVDATIDAGPSLGRSLEEARTAADALNVQVQFFEIRKVDPDVEAAIKAAMRQGPDALITLAGPTIERHRRRVVDLTAKSRLPAIYPTSEFVEVGGLMSYGPDRIDLVRRAAVHVDKLLKGARAAELPVEQPTKFELAVNLRTARALGVTIPPSVLVRADHVVE